MLHLTRWRWRCNRLDENLHLVHDEIHPSAKPSCCLTVLEQRRERLRDYRPALLISHVTGSTVCRTMVRQELFNAQSLNEKKCSFVSSACSSLNCSTAVIVSKQQHTTEYSIPFATPRSRNTGKVVTARTGSGALLGP